MKIEIDTRTDSKHELAILAEMLHKLSNTSSSSRVSGAVIPKPEQKNIFDDPAPTGGMFNMFGGDSSPVPATSVQSEPVESAPVMQSSPAPGGLFSIFGDSSPSAQPEPEMSTQGQTVADLLSAQEDMPKLIDPEPVEEGKTSVKDVLDDDRIVPY